MIASDLPILAERLKEVYGVFGKSAPSDQAIVAWGQTLKEFMLPDVVDYLTGWVKLNSKPPVPADVWKVLNDRRAEKMELDAKAAQARADAEARSTMRRSDKGAKAIQGALKMLGSPPHPKAWAHKAVATARAGQWVHPIVVDMALAALKMTRAELAEAA